MRNQFHGTPLERFEVLIKADYSNLTDLKLGKISLHVEKKGFEDKDCKYLKKGNWTNLTTLNLSKFHQIKESTKSVMLVVNIYPRQTGRISSI